MSGDGTPVTPPPEPATPAATPVDYEAMYRKEVQERITERNLYKPAQRFLAGFDDGTREAMMEFAELVRQGDPEAIAEWNLRTAEAVSGQDVAALIAARQAAANGTPTEQAPSLTLADVEARAREIAAETYAQESLRQQGIAKVTAELKDLGYTHDSAAGETIIRIAVANNIDLPDAAKQYEAEVGSTALERARAAAAAAGTVPQGAPQGTPAGTQPDGQQAGERPEEYSRRLAMSRLKTQPTN